MHLYRGEGLPSAGPQQCPDTRKGRGEEVWRGAGEGERADARGGGTGRTPEWNPLLLQVYPDPTHVPFPNATSRPALSWFSDLPPSLRGHTRGVGGCEDGARELRHRGPCRVLAVRAAGRAVFHGVATAGLWDEVTSEGRRNERSFSHKSVEGNVPDRNHSSEKGPQSGQDWVTGIPWMEGAVERGCRRTCLHQEHGASCPALKEH